MMVFENEFADCVRSALAEQLPLEQVPAMADKVMDNVSARFGGERLYVAKRCSSYAERNAEIRASFTGDNCKVLCRRHRLSRAQVYRIIGK
jgi:Mor family transcriptional regulator